MLGTALGSTIPELPTLDRPAPQQARFRAFAEEALPTLEEAAEGGVAGGSPPSGNPNLFPLFLVGV
jgi:hypothetical protein